MPLAHRWFRRRDEILRGSCGPHLLSAASVEGLGMHHVRRTQGRDAGGVVGGEIRLRPDQLSTITELRAAMREHQSVLLHGQCGWGKTVVAAHMASGAHNKKKRVIFGVHRRELARQTAVTFDRFGIRYGFIAAGMRQDPFALVQIASHGTLMSRPERWKCDLFVPDEAHLWGAKSRADMITEIRKFGGHIVPLTATPERGDGKGLSHIADAMVHGPSTSWLIENGHLAQYKAFAPVSPDFTGLHVRQGDYIVGELEDRFSKPTVIGDRVAAYRKFAMGKRMIGYCYSRKNGEETAATFRASGIPAVFMDGETPDEMRRVMIGEFADGKIPVLLNCQLAREGFDLGAQVGREVPIQAVGLYTPTRSLPLAIQMMMRTLRRQEGHATILDHVNLLKMHGLPDDDREWKLEGRAKKAGGNSEPAIPTVTCHACFGVFRPAPVCPYCGAAREIEGRQVEEVAGEIEELDVEAIRAAKKDEVRRARDLDGLVRIARDRNYKPAWVVNVMKARGRMVTFRQVQDAMHG